MASSKRFSGLVSFIASCLYFFVIILQVPLFRAPCRMGICTSPLEVTCSQLIATEVVPAFLVKPILYPGAIAKAYMNKNTIPRYNHFLKHFHFTNLQKFSSNFDLHHLEIVAGCYLSVVGAMLNLIRHGRISFFGSLLIIWGISREAILRISAGLSPMKTIHIYPAMTFAVLFAFLSIKKDVWKLIHCFKPRRVSKSMRSKLKSS